jgi:hypothetical protein
VPARISSPVYSTPRSFPGFDRSKICTAAVRLEELYAHAADDDDLAWLADKVAERAMLWAYGLDHESFRRADDDLDLLNAIKAFTMAAAALKADN